MQIITLSLNLPLHPGNLRAFRKAIVECVGIENELFHNYNNSDTGKPYNHFDYPLIQYQVYKGKARIIGLGKGAEEILTKLLPQLPPQLTFQHKTYNITGYNLNRAEHEWEILAQPKTYGLYGWIALNKENYIKWKATPLHEDRLNLLSRVFTGHLRAMNNLAGIPDKELIIGEVLEVYNQKRSKYHGNNFVRFHARVASNLNLPIGAGIGRLAASGFGEIQTEANFHRQMRFAKKMVLTM